MYRAKLHNKDKPAIFVGFPHHTLGRQGAIAVYRQSIFIIFGLEGSSVVLVTYQFNFQFFCVNK